MFFKASLMKRIIFDNVIFYWQRSGGISVVWYELISRFLKEGLDVSFIDYENSSDNPFRKRLEIPSYSILKQYPVRWMKLLRYFPVAVKSDEPFIFHSTYYRLCSNRKAINVVTVHDFTYEYFSKGLSRQVHCQSKHNAIRNADHVICISENTKKDLLKFVRSVDEKKISVIYNGVGDAFKTLEPCRRYTDTDEKYLVFIGVRGGYKNFRMAVEAAKHVGMRLVIVGRKLSEEEKTFVTGMLGDNYDDLGFVEDEQLNLIYNKAFALVYPSSYEGFGIPVIEAQKAGCPVVAMNRSSIPEIIGNRELLADNEDSREFADKIRLLLDADCRKRIVSDGLTNSERFSWDNTYRQYKDLYSVISDAKR